MDVVLLFILLPRYGMGGYFISFLVTHLLNFLLSLRRLVKISGVSLSLRAPAICAIALGLSVAMASLLPTAFSRSTACITLLTCLLFLGKVLQKEDLLWLKNMIQRK